MTQSQVPSPYCYHPFSCFDLLLQYMNQYWFPLDFCTFTPSSSVHMFPGRKVLKSNKLHIAPGVRTKLPLSGEAWIDLLKGLISNILTWGVKASIYEFWRDTILFLAVTTISPLDYYKSFLTGIPVFTHAALQPILSTTFGVIIGSCYSSTQNSIKSSTLSE